MNDYHYVYRLRSMNRPSQTYTGRAQDLQSRLKDHNYGRCKATADHRPWQIEVAIAFRSKFKAVAFESYLKTGSGREFARRHF